MSAVAPFHARNEPDKSHPSYRTDDACPKARHIPPRDIRQSTGGFYLCERCAQLKSANTSK